MSLSKEDLPSVKDRHQHQKKRIDGISDSKSVESVALTFDSMSLEDQVDLVVGYESSEKNASLYLSIYVARKEILFNELFMGNTLELEKVSSYFEAIFNYDTRGSSEERTRIFLYGMKEEQPIHLHIAWDVLFAWNARYTIRNKAGFAQCLRMLVRDHPHIVESIFDQVSDEVGNDIVSSFLTTSQQILFLRKLAKRFPKILFDVSFPGALARLNDSHEVGTRILNDYIESNPLNEDDVSSMASFFILVAQNEKYMLKFALTQVQDKKQFLKDIIEIKIDFYPEDFDINSRFLLIKQYPELFERMVNKVLLYEVVVSDWRNEESILTFDQIVALIAYHTNNNKIQEEAQSKKTFQEQLELIYGM